MKHNCIKFIANLLAFFLFTGVTVLLSQTVEMKHNKYLDMDISDLMQVTITSVSKKPQKLSETAAAVFVITQDDIHRLGAASIPEVLRMVPGLQVARISSSKWAITSRGFSGQFANKLLVMIDGRSVYSPVFSGVYWDVQDTLLDDIDRIEVIRGPGATIWGANAVNGVINIITKKANSTTGKLVKIGGGIQDQFMGGFRYGGQVNESICGRAYLTCNKQGSFDIYETGEDAFDDWNSARIGFRLDGKLENKASWTLQGDMYSNEGNQIVTPFWEPVYPYLSQSHDEFDASGWNILGRWQKELSPSNSWNAQFYYDVTNRHEVYMGQTHKTLDFDLQYQHQLGRHHSLVMGLGYRVVDAEYENTFQVSVYPVTLSTHLASGYIQDEISFPSDALAFIIGTKWEHNDYTGHEVQPSVRLRWKVADSYSFWMAVARAVRTPSQLEASGSVVVAVDPTSPPYPLIFTLCGSTRYGSEELIAYEAGFRWLSGANLSMDMSLFYSDYSDLRTTVIAEQSFLFSNGMYGSTHGFELAADWKPIDWVTFQFGYTYIGFDLKLDAPGLLMNFNEVTAGVTPKHQVSLVSTIKVNQRMQFNLWAKYVGKLTASQAFFGESLGIDEYVNLDINIAWWPRKNMELMLVGHNLNHSNRMEYVSEFNVPHTEVKKSAYVKLTYHF